MKTNWQLKVSVAERCDYMVCAFCRLLLQDKVLMCFKSRLILQSVMETVQLCGGFVTDINMTDTHRLYKLHVAELSLQTTHATCVLLLSEKMKAPLRASEQLLKVIC